MKKIIFILIFSILFYAKTSHAFVNDSFERCNINVKPKITFKGSFGKLRYDNNLSGEELEKKAKKKVWGLASVFYNSSTQFKYIVQKKNGGECIVPTEIEIYIGITDPIIYISNDLTPGECTYNLVLRHEETHMQINIRTYEHFLKVVQPNLKKAYKEIKPILVKPTSKYSFNEAISQMSEEYNFIVKNFTEQLRNETDIEHAKLDGNSGRAVEDKICKKVFRIH